MQIAPSKPSISLPAVTITGLELICIATPIIIWALFHRAPTPEDLASLFQINAVFLGCALAGVSAWWIHKVSHKSSEEVIIPVIFSAVAGWYLAIVHACSGGPSTDYLLVQGAATDILHGKLPYSFDSGYAFYPPLYAETLASLYTGFAVIAKLLHWHISTNTVFSLVFYLFQNLQFLSVLGLMYCAYIFVLQPRTISKLHAALLVCAVILLSYPIQATIGWSQVNIFVTSLVLFCCAFSDRLYCARGLALGLTAHLKIYSLLILPAWFLSKQKQACAWVLFWIVLIAVSNMAGFGPAIWTSYFKYAHVHIDMLRCMFGEFMADGPNLQSVVYSTWHLLMLSHLTKIQPHPHMVHLIVQALMITIVLWFSWCVMQRTINYKKTADTSNQAAIDFFYANVSDLLSLGLIAGPITLNHHYVLAIPIILWSIMSAGKSHPFAVLLGCMFILSYQSVDFHTHSTTWMQLQPIGLLLLAWARGRQANSSMFSRAAPAKI